MIIEPFCGSAQYSLYGDNWRKDVILYDKYDVVISVWEYLIHIATPEMILGLPDIHNGVSIDSFNLREEEKYLIGFCINPGSSQPKKTPGKYNSWVRDKQRIAADLHKIKHWRAILCPYDEIPNIDATWFIDPPYQYGGQWYHSSVSNKHLDYSQLRSFCLDRYGQVIVCENTKATWLPFVPLVNLRGQLHRTTEAIYYHDAK
jgi:hypothetical protein